MNAPATTQPDSPQPVSSDLSAVAHNETKTQRATVRDALLWGAASLPFIALALVPRRAQISRLQGEITALSNHMTQQHRAMREELLGFRLAHEEASATLKANTDASERILSALTASHASHAEFQRSALTKLNQDISNNVQRDVAAAAERRKVDRQILLALEDTRTHLETSNKSTNALSKQLTLGLGEVASFIERAEVEHGRDPKALPVVDRLREFAYQVVHSVTPIDSRFIMSDGTTGDNTIIEPLPSNPSDPRATTKTDRSKDPRWSA